MADLSNALKQKLEHLLGMSGGYLMDFTNASFADFVRTSIELDPYDQYQGSKAQILRQLWEDLDNASVGKLMLEMLSRWHTNKLMSAQAISDNDRQLYEQSRSELAGLMGTRERAATSEAFDLAFSFAGEQRSYVEQVARACQARGIKVFFDRDANNEWWGHNFIREQRKIYSSQTRYFVPFISAEYINKPVPMDEFSAAMMTAVKQGDGYILPVLMDDVHVPADLLHPHVHYLHASDYSPDELAAEFARKVGVAEAKGQEPAPLGEVVGDALQFRMPKIVPLDWSKYAELDRIFDYLATQFREGAQQLHQQGLVCHVRQREDHLRVRVERGGDTVAGIDVHRGTQMSDDQITWSVGWRTTSGNSFNGWATPTYDKERSETVVEINNFAAMTGRQDTADGSPEALFRLLWDLLIDQIER